MKILNKKVYILMLVLSIIVAGMPMSIKTYALSQNSDIERINLEAVHELNKTMYLNSDSTAFSTSVLAAPTNIRWEGKIAKCDSVSGAKYYYFTLYKVEGRSYVEVDGGYTSDTSWSFECQMRTELGQGKYVFDVCAAQSFGGSVGISSVKSETYNYNATPLGVPTGLKWNGRFAEWNKVNNAAYYTLHLYWEGIDIGEYDFYGKETRLDFSKMLFWVGVGNYTFDVCAIPNSEQYCLSAASKRSSVIKNEETFLKVSIGGVMVTDKNCNDVLGDGKIKFNPNTRTLTLKNVNITASEKDEYFWFNGIDSRKDLTIILEGNNTITYEAGDNDDGTAINSEGELSIIGNGTLKTTVTGKCYFPNYAIRSHENLNIGENVKITAIGGDIKYGGTDGSCKSCGIYSGKIITISGSAVVTAIGGKIENYPYSCGIVADDIVILDSAILKATGFDRAIYQNNVSIPDASKPVKVNTSVTEDGAADWNKTDVLGGYYTTFKYVKIGSEETHAHNNGVLVKGTPATLTKNGSKTYYKCHCGKLFEDSKCTKVINGDINKWKAVARIKSTALDKTTYTYTGKIITPKVKITDSNGKTIADSNYTVTYSKDRKSVGEYKVTVKFKGNYSGTKTFTFKINPKGTRLKAPKSAKKGFTIKWKKVSLKMSKSRISGYQIQYAKSAKFKGAKKKNIKGYKKTGVTVTKLAARKKYYVRVRTYIKVSGKTYYSVWSKAKKVKTK